MKRLDNEHSMCYNIAYIPIYAVLFALFSAYMRESAKRGEIDGKHSYLRHYWASSKPLQIQICGILLPMQKNKKNHAGGFSEIV